MQINIFDMVERSAFHGDLVANLIIKGFRTTNICVTEPFGMTDWQGRWWGVPAGFVSDGASFPGWIRFVPTLIALLLLRCDCVNGSGAFFIAAILQSFVGAALLSDYLEGATIHDFGYSEGVRPKLLCDVIFLVAMLKRISILYEDRDIGLPKAIYRTVRSFVMFFAVAVGGWIPWYAHRWRQRKR